MGVESLRPTAIDLATAPIGAGSGGPGYDPRRARRVIAVLGVALVVIVMLFMTYDLRGSLEYALELRSRKLGALVIVGIALAHASVLFHTITRNRILTPGLLGLDSLYVFIQISAAYLLGTFALGRIDVRVRFLFEVAMMLAFAGVLRRRLLARHSGDLFLLVLVGIVMGAMFSGLTAFVSRLIDPNEYLTLQDRLFASFGAVDRGLLVAAVAAIAVTIAATVPLLPELDVAVLGRDAAIGLGVDYDRVVSLTLAIVVVQVAVATALVGPITFLGLIAANLAYRITGTFRHRHTLPAAALLAAGGLAAGQFVLEEVLGSATRLGIIVSFVGGIVFIGLLVREATPR